MPPFMFGKMQARPVPSDQKEVIARAAFFAPVPFCAQV